MSLAQDKVAKANAVLGERYTKHYGPGGAKRK